MRVEMPNTRWLKRGPGLHSWTSDPAGRTTAQQLDKWWILPRQYRACRFHIRRVELVKFGYSDDCEGCHVAQLGAEAKPHSGRCRERITQAVMSDDVGQQRLRTAEQRLPPVRGQRASATRVEVARRAWMRR